MYILLTNKIKYLYGHPNNKEQRRQQKKMIK